MMAVSYIYVGNIKKRILAIVLQIALLISLEEVMLAICNKGNIVISASNDLNSPLESILTSFVAYPVVLLLSKLSGVKRNEEVPKEYWTQLIILPVTSMFLLSIVYTAEVSNLMELVGTICIFLINIIAFTLYDKLMQIMGKKLEDLKVMEQNRSYEKQMKILTDSLEKTREMKHNIRNDLGAIYSLIDNNQQEEAIKYINKYIDTINSNKSYSESGNVKFDAFINLKCEEATKEGIYVKIKVSISNECKIEVMDFVTIFGNLMDNAIEGVRYNKNRREIDIDIKQNNYNIAINFINSYEHSISKINMQYRTTKQDFKNHGIGLNHVRKIAERYNGIIVVDDKDNRFDVNVLLCEPLN